MANDIRAIAPGGASTLVLQSVAHRSMKDARQQEEL
jgi:hypothetical protein